MALEFVYVSTHLRDCTCESAAEASEVYKGQTEAVRQFFQQHFPDAVPMMPELVDDFFANPDASLVMTKCYPWHYKNSVCLMGDAAHAIVPFYGQGMNAGFEDCTYLNELLNKYHHDFDKVLPEYTRNRKPASDVITYLALNT